MNECESFPEPWFKLLHWMDKEEQHVASTIMWGIWRSQNERLWDQIINSPKATIIRAKKIQEINNYSLHISLNTKMEAFIYYFLISLVFIFTWKILLQINPIEKAQKPSTGSSNTPHHWQPPPPEGVKKKIDAIIRLIIQLIQWTEH